MRRKAFAESLMRQHRGIEHVEQEFSRAIHIVERELHFFIDEDYPLMKFYNQLEEIKWYREQEQKEIEKNKR